MCQNFVWKCSIYVVTHHVHVKEYKVIEHYKDIDHCSGKFKPHCHVLFVLLPELFAFSLDLIAEVSIRQLTLWLDKFINGIIQQLFPLFLFLLQSHKKLDWSQSAL